MSKILTHDELEKRFSPTNVIDTYLQKALSIEHAATNSYKYVYWINTPNGMRLDDEKNHKYGESRKGYDQWNEDNPSHTASYAGVVSLRTIDDRDNGRKVGYITEEKLSENRWSEISILVDDCFIALCRELNVKDNENFKYFITTNFDYFDDGGRMELLDELEVMEQIYVNYHNDEEYKRFIDKLKG
jgi:hypothetical protein